MRKKISISIPVIVLGLMLAALAQQPPQEAPSGFATRWCWRVLERRA